MSNSSEDYFQVTNLRIIFQCEDTLLIMCYFLADSFLANIEYHPFVHDTEQEDNEIYCKGNDALTRLNLSCKNSYYDTI